MPREKVRWKRCAGKDESEPTLGVRDIGHHDQFKYRRRQQRLLRQSNARVVKDPLAVVLLWHTKVDRIHLEILASYGLPSRRPTWCSDENQVSAFR